MYVYDWNKPTSCAAVIERAPTSSEKGKRVYMVHVYTSTSTSYVRALRVVAHEQLTENTSLLSDGCEMCLLVYLQVGRCSVQY